MEGFKENITRYRAVDDRIREHNKALTPLREQRSLIETELIKALHTKELSGINEIKIGEDQSRFRIKREWTKPWTMSKKSLEEYLEGYPGLYERIVEEHQQKLVATEYSIERHVKDE